MIVVFIDKISSKNGGFMAQTTKYDGWRVYKRLFSSYVIVFMVPLIISILGNIGYSAIDSFFIFMLKPIINTGFSPENIHSHLVRYMPIFIFVIFMLRGLFNVTASYALSCVMSGMVMKLRQDLFAKFLTLPAKYYDRSSSGQMVSEMLFSVDQVSSAGGDIIRQFLQSLALVVGLLVVMFLNSWQLTLVLIVMAPVIAFLATVSSKYIRRKNHDLQDKMKQVTSITEENVVGYKVVRFCGAQQYEKSKFNSHTLGAKLCTIKIAFFSSLNTSFVQLLGGSALAIIIFLGTTNILGTQLSVGAFASMAVSMLAILKPLKNLTNLNAGLQKGLAGAVSVFKVLDADDEIDRGTLEIGRAKGAVEFDQVSFSYHNDSSKRVLKDVSFDVKPNETIALVGRSGGGKTTLVSMLPRFYDVTEGAIKIDGEDIQDYRLSDLRKQFALVSQEVVLFDDTVANNIAFGVGDKVDHQKLELAARSAHALDFIEKLPDGFDSVVGDNGVLLSGGQRQRIAIARAIYQDAPILILDEATSALDTESEKHIQQALSELMNSRTTIVIAHRLSTIEHADRIFVVDDGEIVEEGGHQGLLEKGGFYAKLCRMQYSD